MKKLIVLAALAILAYGIAEDRGISLPGLPASIDAGNSAVQSAYDKRQSNIQIRGTGVVARVLSDDLQGSRHQRFILKVDDGLTVLVAHNIDLAPKITGLRPGDTVAFYGEYEWNEKGGVIHWTHRDPAERHIGGWLQHGGKTYQ